MNWCPYPSITRGLASEAGRTSSFFSGSGSGISCEIQMAESDEKTRVWMNPENKEK